MTTTMKAVMLLACVLFLAAMIRKQHEAFAERAARAVGGARLRPDDERVRASARPLPWRDGEVARHFHERPERGRPL